MGACVPMLVFLGEAENIQTIMSLLDGLIIILQDTYDGDDFYSLFFSMRINFRPIKERIETLAIHQNAKIRSKSSLILRLLQFSEVRIHYY
jgi:hypothetical protein